MLKWIRRLRAGSELVEYAPKYYAAGNASLRAVRALVEAWQDDGEISPSERADIQKQLKDAEAVRYMEHFLRSVHRLTGTR